MSNDGVWVKVYPDAAGGAPGAAVISGHNGATVESGKVIDGKTYDIYTFTDDTATDLSLTVAEPGFADVLVVGAGGGGGCHFGSGGGAGGMLEVSGAYLPSGDLPVRVGQGGAGGFKHSGFNAALDGYDGMASRVGSYVSPGGGGGVTNDHTGTNHIARAGRNGGSGSGGSGGSAGGNYAGGFAVTLLGNNGGSGRASADAGGGGGAGAVGGNAPSANTGGTGGAGAPSSITGSPVTFCGGGGGGGTNTAGAGGSGGGGKGGSTGENGFDGLANTGGGAGGCRALDKHGGNGGSGIVIVRVEV